MYRIGIDLGGTNIAAGLVSEDMKILAKVSVPTGASRAPECIVDDMAAACRRLVSEAGLNIGDIAAVGIASPGIANHDDGVIEYANNLPFRRFPIASMLRERFPVDNIRVENDANAAAWGEAVAGAAKGTSNSVMITLGTGVGGGIIIDGKVMSGFNYAGGELGHIVIRAGGQLGDRPDRNDRGEDRRVQSRRETDEDDRIRREARQGFGQDGLRGDARRRRSRG